MSRSGVNFGVTAASVVALAPQGTVTSVSGTTNQIAVATGTSTPVISITAPFVFPGKATTLATAVGSAGFNIPTGTAPTSPVSGDFWNASGILQFFDGTNTQSETTISSASAVTGGTVAQFSGTSGLLVTGPVGANIVVASSPGVGIAHFAGSTQTVTSSAVNLAGADVTGTLPAGNVASLPLQQIVSPTSDPATFADGDHPIVFNSAATTSGRTAFTIGETTAATSGGTANLLKLITITGSTLIPLNVSQGAGVAGAAAPNVVTLAGGAGGSASPANTGSGNVGGGTSLTLGNGSAGGSSSGTGGAGGAWALTSGTGGAQSTSGTGGAGGAISFTTGSGGNGATTGGAGGNYTVTLGAVGTGGTAALGGGFSVVGPTYTGAAQNLANFSATWNNAATVFKGLVVTITNTSANTNSRLLDLIGGAGGSTSVFSVGPTGIVNQASSKMILGVSGTVTTYNNIATAGNGHPACYGVVDATGQTATKSGALYTPTITGLYRVTAYLKVTTAATTSSILGGTTGVVLTYNDGTDAVAQSVTMNMSSQAGNTITIGTGNTGNTTTTVSQGVSTIWAASGTAINYAIGYTSVGGTPMAYEAHLSCELL